MQTIDVQGIQFTQDHTGRRYRVQKQGQPTIFIIDLKKYAWAYTRVGDQVQAATPKAALELAANKFWY